MVKSPCIKDVWKVTGVLLWPVQAVHLFLFYFLVQGSPQGQILKVERFFFRVSPAHASFLHPDISLGLSPCLSIQVCPLWAPMPAIRMHLPDFAFFPTW